MGHSFSIPTSSYSPNRDELCNEHSLLRSGVDHSDNSNSNEYYEIANGRFLSCWQQFCQCLQNVLSYCGRSERNVHGYKNYEHDTQKTPKKVLERRKLGDEEPKRKMRHDGFTDHVNESITCSRNKREKTFGECDPPEQETITNNDDAIEDGDNYSGAECCDMGSSVGMAAQERQTDTYSNSSISSTSSSGESDETDLVSEEERSNKLQERRRQMEEALAQDELHRQQLKEKEKRIRELKERPRVDNTVYIEQSGPYMHRDGTVSGETTITAVVPDGEVDNFKNFLPSNSTVIGKPSN